MYARSCDICLIRTGIKTIASEFKKWRYGIRLDVCRAHERLLFHIKNWDSWQVDCWKAKGCIAIPSLEAPRKPLQTFAEPMAVNDRPTYYPSNIGPARQKQLTNEQEQNELNQIMQYVKQDTQKLLH